ncbi:23172_t:CDS:1 [Cetraspora pellucida]|uniref:23172_t:CDS:1 n=1 Tax=Cetraspora pellucida TaxID=1433469 RepID=A0A9N9NVV2_9GLOM|nr:23172_t:CDS:1 [Cetraspora pellucida]
MTNRYQDVSDYHLHVKDRNPQIEEIDNTRDMNSLHFQPNNQTSQQIIYHTNSQHVQPSQSNINNQASRQIVRQTNLHNDFLQQIISQNHILITMIQNISNIPSVFTNIQNTPQLSVPQNNDTIITNSPNIRQSSVSQNNDNIFTNTPQPSVPQNNVNTISPQNSSSKHQINICDSCMNSNFSNIVTEPSSKHQINICDSCMKSNFSSQTTSVSVSHINNNQIISNQVNNTPDPQNTTPTQQISNCTTVNINSFSWKLGYVIIIFGLVFLVGIIFYVIKQLSVVSLYEEIGSLFFTIKIDLGQFVKILGPTIIGGIVNWIMKQRNGIKN